MQAHRRDMRLPGVPALHSRLPAYGAALLFETAGTHHRLPSILSISAAKKRAPAAEAPSHNLAAAFSSAGYLRSLQLGSRSHYPVRGQVVCRSLPFACSLVTLHNLTYMARLGREIRVRTRFNLSEKCICYDCSGWHFLCRRGRRCCRRIGITTSVYECSTHPRM